MDIIKMTRELCKAIQQDERYLNLKMAESANDSSPELQEKIKSFSDLRAQINLELTKDDKDQEKLSRMDAELRAAYNVVMETPEMIAYSDAKNEVEDLLGFVNQIIMGSIAGQNPDLIEKASEESCGGSCDSCGGCH